MKLIAGKWELVSQLGTGSFGDVWVARHSLTGKRKALKLLHARFSDNIAARDRFVEEAQASARIDSPHVVSIDDVGFDEGAGRAYLVMELLRGVTLYDHLVEPPYNMSASEVVYVLRQVAAALDAAHSAGVVHRDLKPENVFLSWHKDGSVLVKVVDFGIAKLNNVSSVETQEAGPRRVRRTRTEGFLGTPGYAAPEQILDAGQVGPTADVFSLGVVAFEMLAGSPYWKGEGVAALSEAFDETLEPPSKRMPAEVSVPKAFDTWFFRACARDSNKRFASPGEAVQALAEALEVQEPLLVPPQRVKTDSLPEITGQHSAMRVSAIPPMPEPSVRISTRPAAGSSDRPNSTGRGDRSSVRTLDRHSTEVPALSRDTTPPARSSSRTGLVMIVSAVLVVGTLAGSIFLLRSPRTPASGLSANTTGAPAQTQTQTPPVVSAPPAPTPVVNPPPVIAKPTPAVVASPSKVEAVINDAGVPAAPPATQPRNRNPRTTAPSRQNQTTNHGQYEPDGL